MRKVLMGLMFLAVALVGSANAALAWDYEFVADGSTYPSAAGWTASADVVEGGNVYHISHALPYIDGKLVISNSTHPYYTMDTGAGVGATGGQLVMETTLTTAGGVGAGGFQTEIQVIRNTGIAGQQAELTLLIAADGVAQQSAASGLIVVPKASYNFLGGQHTLRTEMDVAAGTYSVFAGGSTTALLSGTLGSTTADAQVLIGNATSQISLGSGGMILDSVAWTDVPEPATLALLSVGALGFIRRKK